jgi:hypothetical protein
MLAQKRFRPALPLKIWQKTHDISTHCVHRVKKKPTRLERVVQEQVGRINDRRKRRSSTPEHRGAFADTGKVCG